MAITFLPAQGTTLTIADSGGSPVAIGEITGYTGFDGEAPDIDETTFADTEFMTFRQGLQDGGSVNVDVFRDPNDVGQAECKSAADLGATREFVLTITDYGTITFNGYVKALPINGGVDQSITGTIPIKITGDPVYAAT
jgi:hypothetical protein